MGARNGVEVIVLARNMRPLRKVRINNNLFMIMLRIRIIIHNYEKILCSYCLVTVQ